MSKKFDRLLFALKAAAWHLLGSLLFALAAGFVIFDIWFPHPFISLAGGLVLFWVLIGVDLVCGPLLTLVLFNPKKKKPELILDMSLVVAVQVCALVYGMHSISMARPVAVVHEVDRFVAVTRAQVMDGELGKAPPGYQAFSWLVGPRWMGTRDARDGAEKWESIQLSLQGIEPSARPSWWQSYEESRPRIQQSMQPLASLLAKQPQRRSEIEAAAQQANLSMESAYFFPLVSQKYLDQWSALLDKQGNIVGFVAVGGF